jgi:hypothetical protein
MLHNKANPICCFRLYASAQRARISDAYRRVHWFAQPQSLKDAAL